MTDTAQREESPLGKRRRRSKKSANGKKSNANKNARKKGAIMIFPIHSKYTKAMTLKRDIENLAAKGSFTDFIGISDSILL